MHVKSGYKARYNDTLTPHEFLHSPISLGQRNIVASSSHECILICVHATSSSGSKRTGCVALRSLGWSGVIHHMVFEVLRKPFTTVHALQNFCMCLVSGYNECPREVESGGHRVLGQQRSQFTHGNVDVDVHCLSTNVRICNLRKVLRHISLELLQKHAIFSDFTLIYKQRTTVRMLSEY